jgi:hypothetical protein
MSPGDLAWLPSNTALLSFDGSSGTVKQWCYPKEPQHVFIIGERDEVYYEVLYRGATWSVPKSCLYE